MIQRQQRHTQIKISVKNRGESASPHRHGVGLFLLIQHIASLTTGGLPSTATTSNRMSHSSYCGDCVINSSATKRICRYFLVVITSSPLPKSSFLRYLTSVNHSTSSFMLTISISQYRVREIASRVKLINRDKAAVILALQNINSTD